MSINEKIDKINNNLDYIFKELKQQFKDFSVKHQELVVYIYKDRRYCKECLNKIFESIYELKETKEKIKI